jgi:hypothetical protein
MKSFWMGIYTLIGPAMDPHGQQVKNDAWLGLLNGVVSYDSRAPGSQ